MSTNESFVPMSQLRTRTIDAAGRRQWRSLDELADSPRFQALLKAEFTEGESLTAVNRRDFIKLMGASMALAGATGCTRQPKEMIIPYVKQPEELVPGKPLYYATAVTWQGIGRGALVESHMGRPTKIEGNPDHPDGAGSSSVLMQAAILGLYDPDRSQTVKYRGRISTWDKFLTDLQAARDKHTADQGDSLRLLTGPITSPTQLSLIQELLAAFPKARWHRYAPLARDAAYAGARMVFQQPLETRFDLDAADVILSLDADFLYEGAGALRYARQFAARRQPQGEQAGMNRLYVAECTPSVTGSIADHRLSLGPKALLALATAVAGDLGIEVGATVALEPAVAAWASAVAADLQAHRGRSLVVAGDYQPPVVHALAQALNAALGNVGSTVFHTEPLDTAPQSSSESLRALVDDLRLGKVQSLFILGTNPVYDAPAETDFAQALQAVALRVHWGLYEDETAEHCHWHLPAAHDLECWGDVRAFDGTITIQQPLIEALYGGRSAAEIIDALLGRSGRPAYDVVRAHWEKQRGGLDFDAFWKRTIHDGFIAGSAFATQRPALAWDGVAMAALLKESLAVADGIEIVVRPDPSVWDGSLANNGWLQELPKPLTKLTWENAALVSPSFAEKHGLRNSDVIVVSAGGKPGVELPAWILPGQPANAVTVNLGYGRTHAGRVGNGLGASAYTLFRPELGWALTGGEIFKTGTNRPLACTQDHHSMEGRELVRSATVTHFQENPEFVREHSEHGPDTSLYPDHPYEGYKWGMTIDLNTCLGCNACTIACQAENNIAVVGKGQVAKGREMHWIRVDRYFEGDLDQPEVHHQPIPCMQCERAPCEPVCPVGATAHSSEGLNDMVYNRCVGTRYCSNNCPFKVRRFNFLAYTDDQTPSLKLQRNPDVTVRMRGVMEKCTYCVQRINVARIQAKVENRRIRDGEVVTACQQACPVGAIAFGDLNDAQSAVRQRKADPRNYGLLDELGVRPRTTYLAKLRNPNPALVTEGGSHGH
ncbi:MAG: TAT-variant-translocated molybdopterin oxidoreductase [Lentisphaerae bacterium]|nr:TAT-variant-translocated molybdopterin oxidoreductase [Lentisphaerota bacterium]